ncbi:MAG: hypothetical protein IPM29_24475 [Planctomycetes bacterium]|nr:hypothetical protein [Planctomycetota bacterium]
MDPRIARTLSTVAVLTLGAWALPAQIAIARASLSSTGAEANAPTPISASGNTMAVSADGRFVAFVSNASNLVPGDSNGVSDVFVRDLATGTTERVNVSTSGAQMLPDKYGRGCFDVAVSGDGRYVAFSTAGKKLIDGEKGGGARGDVYLRDRQLGTTERISLSSSDGAPNGDSWYASLSADGRYVAFYSFASNLVASDRNRTADVFVRDLWTRTNVRASVDSAGREANGESRVLTNGALSADGHCVVFVSVASDLVNGDRNGVADVFVRDLVAGTTTRVNLTPAGGESTGGIMLGTQSISGDGRYATYVSRSADLLPAGAPRDANDNYYYQAFRYDRTTGTTAIISLGPNGDLADHGIGVGMIGSSADGRFVTFVSGSTNLVAGSPALLSGVFVRDSVTGLVALASVGLGGAWPDGAAFPWQTLVSADGTALVFGSSATNLVAGDTNGMADVFVAH